MDYAASAFEIKQLNDSGSIEGLLAGFGNVDSHGDRIAPGAFTKTLAARGDRPLPMLLHHDLKRPVGAWRSWQETGHGLYVKGSLTMGTRDAQEAHALATAGALTGLSIGYTGAKGKPDQRTGVRDLTELDLMEGSLVTIPSNPKTFVASVKAIAGARDIEDLFRESGMSTRRAKVAASAAWKALNTDEPEDDSEVARILKESAARIAGKSAPLTPRGGTVRAFDWS